MEGTLARTVSSGVLEDNVSRTEYESPEGELEHIIAKLWQETFRLERVGRNDNFFELGGNSLTGMELMDKISSSLDVQLPVVALFQNPTPMLLAHYIDTPEYSDT